MKRANMAFTGIASFGRCPVVQIDEDWQANFAVLGVPYDAGAGYRPGARFGPRSIRDVSTRFAFFGGTGSSGYWNIGNKKPYLSDVTVVDAGDTDVLYLDVSHCFESIESSVGGLLKHGAIPVILGGDHSISYPVVKAFSSLEDVAILHLDAHLDFRDELLGVRLAHGSPLRRLSELPFVTSAVAIGLRGLRHNLSDYRDALDSGVVIVSATEIHQNGEKHALGVLERTWEKDRPVYVTIDVDFLDPAFAPGTGTPEPGGFTYQVLMGILEFVTSRFNVVGFDIVEVNPMVDASQITALLAAQAVIEFMGFIDENRKSQ